MNGQSVKPSQFPGPYWAIVTKWAKSFVPAGYSLPNYSPFTTTRPFRCISSI